MRYASKISGNNLEFLATLDAENGKWTPDRIHDLAYWRDGKEVKGKFMPAGYYHDYGFCGTSDFYQWDIYADSRFFSDPYWQLDQCWKLYQEGTTFHGRNRLHNEPAFKSKIYSHFLLTTL